eukprot:TRINITY_DN11136_c1_g1_i1.p1 TRINITY_DN11136_c1_g1~~TRINITY_DN11136_c1_g1_i1.p1  ORF type:complete len:1463 (+),score=373.89 TRINITY_DN11136_c1_g1_i1:74-4390(+)
MSAGSLPAKAGHFHYLSPLLGRPEGQRWQQHLEDAHSGGGGLGRWPEGYVAACKQLTQAERATDWNARYQGALRESGGQSAAVAEAFSVAAARLCQEAAERWLLGRARPATADAKLEDVVSGADHSTFLCRRSGIVLHVSLHAGLAARVARLCATVAGAREGTMGLTAPVAAAFTALGVPVLAAAAAPLRCATQWTAGAAATPVQRAAEAALAGVAGCAPACRPGVGSFVLGTDGEVFFVPSGSAELQGARPEAGWGRSGGGTAGDAAAAGLLRGTPEAELGAGAVSRLLHANGVRLRRLGTVAAQVRPSEAPAAARAVQAEILARTAKAVAPGDLREHARAAVAAGVPAPAACTAVANRLFHHFCGGEGWLELVPPLVDAKFGGGCPPVPPSGQLRVAFGLRLAALLGAVIQSNRVMALTCVCRGSAAHPPPLSEETLRERLEAARRGAPHSTVAALLEAVAEHGPPDAAELLGEAERLRREAAASGADGGPMVLCSLALRRSARGQPPGKAAPLLAEAVWLLRAARTAPGAGSEEQLLLASALIARVAVGATGWLRSSVEMDRQNIAALEEAVALCDAAYADSEDPADTARGESLLAEALRRLRALCLKQGQLPKAERALQRLRRGAHDAAQGRGSPQEAQWAAEHGSVLADLNRGPEARAALSRAADIFTGLHGDKHPEAARALNNLACVDYALAREAHERARAAPRGTPEAEALGAESRELCLRARSNLDRVLAVASVWGSDEGLIKASCTNNLASVHFLLGEFAEAERLFADALQQSGENAAEPARNLEATRSRIRKERSATTIEAAWRMRSAQNAVGVARRTPLLAVSGAGPDCDGGYVTAKGLHQGQPRWVREPAPGSESSAEITRGPDGHWVIAPPEGDPIFRAAAPARRGEGPPAVQSWERSAAAGGAAAGGVVVQAREAVRRPEDAARAEESSRVNIEVQASRGVEGLVEEAARGALALERAAGAAALGQAAAAAKQAAADAAAAVAAAAGAAAAVAADAVAARQVAADAAARERAAAEADAERERVAAAAAAAEATAAQAQAARAALVEQEREEAQGRAAAEGAERAAREEVAAVAAAAEGAEAARQEEAARRIQNAARSQAARRESTRRRESRAEAEGGEEGAECIGLLLAVGAERGDPMPALSVIAGLPLPAGWAAARRKCEEEERNAAATRIQSLARGGAARGETARRRSSRAASEAAAEEAAARQAEEAAAEAAERDEAAQRIQQAVRSRHARRESEQRRQSRALEDDEEEGAAEERAYATTMMQRVLRGMGARNWLRGEACPRATQFVNAAQWRHLRDPLAAGVLGIGTQRRRQSAAAVGAWLERERAARDGMLTRECSGRRTLLLRLAVQANRRRLVDGPSPEPTPHRNVPALVCCWRPPPDPAMRRLTRAGKRLPRWARHPEAQAWIAASRGRSASPCSP